MKRMTAAAVFAVLTSVGAAPLAAQTSITIYNDGRVLVRRSVPAQIAKGASTQRLTLGALDPATIFPLDSGVTLFGVRYDAAVDEASVLRRSVGRRVVFRLPESNDTISAVVLGVDPLRLQLPDGRVSFRAPGAALYPADVVVTEPTASLSLRSSRALDRLRLGYFTGGASWQASYQIVLGGAAAGVSMSDHGTAGSKPAGGTAQVNGMAVLASESLRVEDAEVQLLAGSVNRAQQPPQPPRPLMARAEAMAMDQMKAEAASEQRVGEFHVYSLPGRSTLLPGLTTSVALFEPARVEYERHYVVHGMVPYWGFIPQQGEETEAPVEVTYTVKRPRKTDFGDRPLPMGTARVYQADSTGRLQLVGEAAVNHTAPNEDLKLSAGTAFDLTARRVQTSYTTRRDSSKAGIRTLAFADYRVTLRNATDSAVTIDVQEERAGEWSVVSSSVPAEKISSTITRFRVRVPARGEAVLTYRIRAVW